MFRPVSFLVPLNPVADSIKLYHTNADNAQQTAVIESTCSTTSLCIFHSFPFFMATSTWDAIIISLNTLLYRKLNF